MRAASSDAEGLRHVLLHAQLEGVDLGELLGLRGEHDDRDAGGRRVAADVHERNPAVDLRHHDVENNDVDVLAAERRDARLAVRRANDLHALGGQTHANHLDDLGVVVDHEYPDVLVRHRSYPLLNR